MSAFSNPQQRQNRGVSTCCTAAKHGMGHSDDCKSSQHPPSRKHPEHPHDMKHTSVYNVGGYCDLCRGPRGTDYFRCDDGCDFDICRKCWDRGTENPSAARMSKTENPSAARMSNLNRFGFKVLSRLSSNQDDAIVISPTSIFLALALAANGARDKTREEILNLFDLKSIESMNQLVQFLVDDKFLKKDPQKVLFHIANSVWGQSLRPDFQIQTKKLKADVKVGVPTVGEINQWCADKTNQTPFTSTALGRGHSIVSSPRWATSTYILATPNSA